MKEVLDTIPGIASKLDCHILLVKILKNKIIKIKNKFLI